MSPRKAEAAPTNGKAAPKAAPEIPAPYEADAYIQTAKENGSQGKFSAEVAALKIFEALTFFNRMGLDRSESSTLAVKAVELELKMMEIHVAARKVVLEDEQGNEEATASS